MTTIEQITDGQGVVELRENLEILKEESEDIVSRLYQGEYSDTKVEEMEDELEEIRQERDDIGVRISQLMAVRCRPVTACML